MKRLLALVLGGLGLRALLRRRRAAALPDTSAEDLRAKLAEARSTVDEQIEEPAKVDDRRADVHARARQAIDELRDGGE